MKRASVALYAADAVTDGIHGMRVRARKHGETRWVTGRAIRLDRDGLTIWQSRPRTVCRPMVGGGMETEEVWWDCYNPRLGDEIQPEGDACP